MTQEQYTFRKMTRKDVPRIAELERICFRSPWSEAALRSEISNPVAYYGVMEHQGEIIAYCGMWAFLGEAHITNVAVAPEHRGQGLGREMMLHMMRTARRKKADAMTLEVRETNTVAQNLYHSLGFVKAAERKGYYADTGENAWIMWNTHLDQTLCSLDLES